MNIRFIAIFLVSALSLYSTSVFATGGEMPSLVHDAAAAVTLHHFIDGEFLSGSHPWPADVEDNRIDRRSGLTWAELKKSMMGSRS